MNEVMNDIEQIDFIICEEGIAKIEVIDDDITAEYYLAEVQTDV